VSPAARGRRRKTRQRDSARERCTASLAANTRVSSQCSVRRRREIRGQRSCTTFAVGPSWQMQKIGRPVECKGSSTTERISRRNSPTIATSNPSTAKRGHKSPLSTVNAGGLRSICQRAVMRREKSTSSEMISTVGASTSKSSLSQAGDPAYPLDDWRHCAPFIFSCAAATRSQSPIRVYLRLQTQPRWSS
jgi:hypothetical protein